MEMTAPSGFGLKGRLRCDIVIDGDPKDVNIQGVDWKRDWNVDDNGLWLCRVERDNGFVNIGLNIVLDRLFGLSGPPAAVSHIGVSNDTATVLAAATLLDPTAGGGSPASPVIKAISPAATRTAQDVTGGATFTQADVGFAMTKVGFLNTSTDAGTGLIDIIGGTGGAAPYAQPFTIDLTGATSWSMVMQIKVTAASI